MMVSLMQNKDETDNMKAMIMVSFDDFSDFLAFSSIYYTTLHSRNTHTSNHGLI